VTVVAADAQTVLTFAYGSNMLTARIRKRCHSATVRGVAQLHGNELRWHKRSTDGSGKCDVVTSRAPGNVVYGVLFTIAQSEKAALDRAEGLGNGYAEKVVEVLASGTRHTATLYYATAVVDGLRPYSWYKDLVVAGAKEHGLPAEYIAWLEATAATADPDRDRDGRNRAILTTGHQP